MNRAGMEFVARVASPSRLGWDKLLCRFALNLPCVVPARLTCHCQEQANGTRNGNSRRLVVYAYRIAVTRRSGLHAESGFNSQCRMQGTEFNKDEQELSKNNTIRAAKALPRPL